MTREEWRGHLEALVAKGRLSSGDIEHALDIVTQPVPDVENRDVQLRPIAEE